MQNIQLSVQYRALFDANKSFSRFAAEILILLYYIFLVASDGLYFLNEHVLIERFKAYKEVLQGQITLTFGNFEFVFRIILQFRDLALAKSKVELEGKSLIAYQQEYLKMHLLSLPDLFITGSWLYISLLGEQCLKLMQMYLNLKNIMLFYSLLVPKRL